MDVITITLCFKKIKHFLVFFVLILNLSCSKNIELKDVEVIYQDNKAMSIRFKSAGASDNFSIYLKHQNTPVLGEIKIVQEFYEFTPVIPFSNNLEYIVKNEGKQQASFKIKRNKSLIGIFYLIFTFFINKICSFRP